jgi:hypothetical protein
MWYLGFKRKLKQKIIKENTKHHDNKDYQVTSICYFTLKYWLSDININSYDYYLKSKCTSIDLDDRWRTL